MNGIKFADELHGLAESVALRERSRQLLLLTSPHFVGPNASFVDRRVVLVMKCNHRVSCPIFGELDDLLARCAVVAHPAFSTGDPTSCQEQVESNLF